MMLFLLLLPVAFLSPHGAQAGEIIGGWEARPHSRPYMAFVKIEHEQRGSNCGGFLIQEDVVVMAAHCNCNLGNITVLLGAHNVAIEERGRQEIRVCRRIPHPEYNDEMIANDIVFLQEVDLKIMGKDICLSRPYPHYVPSLMLCVRDPLDQTASFQGDSGGPLVCDGKVQGIVSYGKKDGLPPRVFTKVIKYVSWIKNILHELKP